MKLPPKLRPLHVWLAALIVFAVAAPAFHLQAQTSTETKIKLMAEALRARDAREWPAARKAALELLAIAPGDLSVQRLLRQINDAEAADQVRPAAVEAPPVSAPIAAPTSVVPLSEVDRELAALEAEAEAVAREEAKRVADLMARAPAQRKEARKLASAERYDDALAELDAAIAALPANPATVATLADLRKERQAIADRQSEALARAAERQARAEAKAAKREAARTRELAAAEHARVESEAPAAPELSEIDRLVQKGRSQYLAGEEDGAMDTFREVEALDPGNREAKDFLRRIAAAKARTGELNREKTRAQLLEEVTKSWQRPGLYEERTRTLDAAVAVAPLARKLNEIVLPHVSFTRLEIGKVIAALGAMSEDFDPAEIGAKGVNIVLLDPANKAPSVTLTLRNTTLKRVLDFVTESVGYQYEVQPDAVIVRPGGETSTLETAFFPITRATVLRMTGVSATAVATRNDGLSSAGASNDPGAGVSNTTEAAGMRSFLQQAGVNFDPTAVPGASLAYDGSALIVTQTPRNIERIRNILNRYNDVRQVEIEAKFMEVQEGALEELGVNWSITTKSTQRNAGAQATYQSGNRPLANAFSNSVSSQQGRIIRPAVPTIFTDSNGNGQYDPGETISQQGSAALDIPIVNNAPQIPGGVDLANGANPLANISAVIGEFDVNAIVRALSQKQGTDLLSAPKVTVLSGNPATITVAQEMRYPQSYGQTQAQVGTGSASGGGSAGVAITAGTPQEFTARNVGVELKVTPTVEEDDYSISLDLNPRVTEFDGFVEYGGPSIAISGSTTVNVPSGFYQPIFSVRDISTKVTIWDGATLVMGGLTREEVKKVSDKVPILGDIPLLGRAFRSKGESAQKRNLLIFVTANLVSPGGSPKKQALKNVPANSLFQNPTVVTPAGSELRTRTDGS